MTNDTPKDLRGAIEQALRNLEQLGLVRRTGEFRDGKPVWEWTETKWEKTITKTNPTPRDLDAVEQVGRNLEQLGLVHRTGEFLGGRPLWEKTVKSDNPVIFNVPKTPQWPVQLSARWKTWRRQ